MAEPADGDQKGAVQTFKAGDAHGLVGDARRGRHAHDEDGPPALGERRGGHGLLGARAAEAEASVGGAGLRSGSGPLVVGRDLALSREEPGRREPEVQQSCDGVRDAIGGDLEEAVVCFSRGGYEAGFVAEREKKKW